MKELFSIEGKTILLTGALGFLGSYFCEELAKAGAHLIIIDLDNARCIKFAEELSKKYNTKNYGYGLDITNESDVKNTADTVRQNKQNTGKIDVIINNAQGGLPKDIKELEKLPLENWEKEMKVNTTGAFLIVKHFSGLLKDGGAIINVSSIYGDCAPDFRIYEGTDMWSPIAYSASKAGLHGMTKYLSVYFSERKIRVNTLTPGGVESKQPEIFKEKYSNRVPLRRMAKKDDLLGPLIFLCSNASNYITGEQIRVDGGLHVW